MYIGVSQTAYSSSIHVLHKLHAVGDTGWKDKSEYISICLTAGTTKTPGGVNRRVDTPQLQPGTVILELRLCILKRSSHPRIMYQSPQQGGNCRASACTAIKYSYQQQSLRHRLRGLATEGISGRCSEPPSTRPAKVASSLCQAKVSVLPLTDQRIVYASGVYNKSHEASARGCSRHACRR